MKEESIPLQRSKMRKGLRVTQVARNLREAAAIEDRINPATFLDIAAIVVTSFATGFSRLGIWVWGRLLLRLTLPEKNFRPTSIIVYLQGMLGDVSVHLPAIFALHTKFPDAELTCICCSEGFPILPLLEGLPYISKVIVIPEHPVVRRGRRMEFSSPELHGLRCDLFVNLSRFINGGVPGYVAREMAFARMCKARRYIGGRYSLYGTAGWLKRAKRFFIENEPRRAWNVLKPLGIESIVSSESALPEFHHVKSVVSTIATTYAVLHPGAKFVVQLWPAEYYGKVAVYLNEKYSCRVIITGSAREYQIGEKVRLHSGGVAINFCGQTSIPELVELLRGAHIVVTNDTGTMHLSSLLNRPTVAIFGTRNSIKQWFPKGKRTSALFCYHEDSFSFDDVGAVLHRLDLIKVSDVCVEIDHLLSGNGESEKNT